MVLLDMSRLLDYWLLVEMRGYTTGSDVLFGDILLKIMGKLNVNSVRRGACVSRRWRDASEQPIVYGRPLTQVSKEPLV